METERKKKVKVLNVIWGFSTGGIGKLFQTYSTLGKFDTRLDVSSVCIDLQNCEYDRQPLNENNIKILPIKNRRDFSWVIKLGKLAKEIKPSVVFCHGFNGPIVVKVCSLFEKHLRVPMVCTYHGLYNPPTKNKVLLAGFINRLQAWMYKVFAHKVILVAKYSGEYLLNQGVERHKLMVVYNGICEEEPQLDLIKLESTCINIGMVGRLDAIKGVNYLIDAIPKVRQKVSENFHVYIVGDGPEEKTLQEKVQLFGVSQYVSFVGYQSNIPAWLKAWDVFCLPSLQENHSIALLEAMRAGKAIVCTEVGGNTETVNNGIEALVVPPCNSDALADALAQCIKSESLRSQLGENASIRFYNCFTETVMKEKLCNILYNTINNEA